MRVEEITINGMFFDPLQNKIYDFVGGQEDLKKGIIRTIGNPYDRFREDRLRMIRAVRFANRFTFQIEEETSKAIELYSHSLLPAVSMERIWQEFIRMYQSRRFGEALLLMHRLGLLETVFPDLREVPLSSIKERVRSFAFFRDNTPAIISIAALFPKASSSDLISICKYLKTSNEDIKWVECFSLAKDYVLSEKRESIKETAWAHFFALQQSKTCLEANIAIYYFEQREEMLEYFTKKEERLLPFIKRIQEKRPLISSSDLNNEGIKPGKMMGLLLKEAEAISIENLSEDKNFVIEKLKKLPLWMEALSAGKK